MRRRAKILAWGIVAMAAGVGAPAVAAEKQREPVVIPSFPSGAQAPAFGPFYVLQRPAVRNPCLPTGVQPEPLMRQGPPKENTDYKRCSGDCKNVTFTIGFDEKGCPISAAPSVKNCCTAHDLDSCTAMDRAATVVFAKGGKKPYLVRFAPFGPPIPVEKDKDSGELAIETKAPVAWYKFTVYVDDAQCEGFDPNIIVTN